MAKKNPTKKQHYIPQFYLRQWVDETGGFYPIRIENKTPPNLTLFKKKSNPIRFCAENFFYAQHTGKQDDISQFLEKNFADIEGIFTKKLPELEKKILNHDHISDEDKYHLSEFMIFLWLKGKKWREESQRMSEYAFKQFNKHLVYDCDKAPKIKEKMEKLNLTKQDMIEFVEDGEYSVDFGNMHHLSLMKEMYGFCNLLSAKYWKIYISQDGRFITTDAPYLDMPTASKAFWGNDFLSREQYFILSPRVTIITKYPKNKTGKKIARKDITNNKSLIQSINCHHLMNSIKFGFHKERSLIEDIQRFVSRAYQAS